MSGTTHTPAAGISTDAVADRALEAAQHLLDWALGIFDLAIPAEDVSAALPVIDDEPESQHALIELMQQYLNGTFSHLHTPGCETLESRFIVSAIASLVCPGCVPKADVRAAVRFASKPTQYQRDQFHTDPEHWGRIMALVVATVLDQGEDPYGDADFLTSLLGL